MDWANLICILRRVDWILLVGTLFEHDVEEFWLES